MRRWRHISKFGEAEFLGASFHDAPRSLEGRSLAAFAHILCRQAQFSSWLGAISSDQVWFTFSTHSK